jgi:DNA-binding beta-propeller fold protein YncE
MQPGIFLQPEGSALDNSGNIFIADAAKDSIFKFNAYGDKLLSFGGSENFNQPQGVAFFNKTLYVADTGNDRILRFTLSTEL